MAALHARGVLHLDLKPANVLIGRSGEGLVADFGLSVQLRSTLTAMSTQSNAGIGTRGTWQYKAPELWDDERKLPRDECKPVDVYSFSILLWELLTGERAWQGFSEMKMMTAHYKANSGHAAPRRPALDSGADWADWATASGACPAEAVELTRRCWSQDPAARPSFDKALQQLGALVAAHPVADGAGAGAAAAAVALETLTRQLADAEAQQAELQTAARDATVGREALLAQLQLAEDEVLALQLGRGEAAAERDRLQAALRDAVVVFPGTWTAQHDDRGDRGSFEWWRGGRAQVEVPRGADEWTEVEALLHASLPAAALERLERVEDRLLWKDYRAKVERIELKRGGEDGANEQRLWHGTSRLDPRTALQHEAGLDPRFASAAFYGRGLYLAAEARYPDGDTKMQANGRLVRVPDPDHPGRHRAVGRMYAYCPAFPDCRTRQLLLVRAAVGLPDDCGATVDAETRALTKPREEAPGQLYDSVQGGPHRPSRTGPGDRDSTMVILYDLAQAYPEYVVTYRV